MDKKSLTERDICTKYITPAIEKAGWDKMTQIREEKGITDGRIQAQGQKASRLKHKKADYILSKQDIDLAVIEAKNNKHSISSGIQQSE